MYHYEEICVELGTMKVLPDSTGMTFNTLNQVENNNNDDDDLLIESISDVVQPPSPKPGNAGLNLLDAANTVIETGRTILSGTNKEEKNSVDQTSYSEEEGKESGSSKSVVESYFFNFWNERDMASAIELFDVDCDYNDMQYTEAFRGKDAMKAHLEKVASCLPKSFSFKIDKIVTEMDASSR